MVEAKEPQVLTPKRTEFGKAIRKRFESHEIQMSALPYIPKSLCAKGERVITNNIILTMTLTINNTTYEPTISSESTIVCIGCDLLPMCSHKICDAIDSETYTQFKKVRT